MINIFIMYYYYITTYVRIATKDKIITTYEASIPWVHIFGKKISPASLTSFYFSLLVNDNDGKSRGWIEYCPGIGWNKDSTAFIEIPVSK